MELFDKTIGATFLQLAFRFHDIEKQISEEVKLTTDEMRCLVTIYLQRPSCVRELISAFMVEPTRTSKILKSLENKKLLHRELDTIDRRRTRLQLSEHGRTISEKILTLSNRFGKTIFDSSKSELLLHLNSLLNNSPKQEKGMLK